LIPGQLRTAPAIPVRSRFGFAVVGVAAAWLDAVALEAGPSPVPAGDPETHAASRDACGVGTGGASNRRETMIATREGRRSLPLQPAAWLVSVGLLYLPAAVQTQAGGSPLPLRYPETPTVDVVDDYHGTLVPDPYRWLEEMDSPEVLAWVTAQNALTHGFLDQLPGRPLLRERLAGLWTHEQATPPVRVGDRYFYRYSDGTHEQSLLYWREGLDGQPQALINPNVFSHDGSVTLRNFSPSPDGRHVAYILQERGQKSIHVREVDTNNVLNDRLDVGWATWQMLWTADGAGFFYTSEADRDRVHYHRLGTPQEEDLVVYERPDNALIWFSLALGHAGEALVIVAQEGHDRNTGIYALDLVDPRHPNFDGPVRPLIEEFDAAYGVVGLYRQTLFLQTDLDAPMGRVIAVRLQQPEREHWRTVIPERDAVLATAGLAGNVIVTRHTRDVVSVASLFSEDGRFLREIEFPAPGAAGLFPNRYGELFYRFSSHLHPPTIYRLDLATNETSVFRQPRLDFDASQYVTRQLFYESKDGTRVPMFLTHRRDLSLDGSNPTVLTGYGGFGISVTPSFSPDRIAWLEMGGIFAMANIRGGGEYGAEWHEAGIGENRQVVFDDFIAAAEYLIAEGYSSPERLAVSGASNGGLLVGAVITQRPDLFEAALLHGSVLDMLRFPHFGDGLGTTAEYGSPDDPGMIPILYGYSPVHNVRAGTCYPATLVMHSEHDANVVPMHSYKFAAALQKAQSCERPVLLRVEQLSGHGTGRTQSMRIAAAADQWSFLMQALGMTRYREMYN
jgi:prolyl oligopeptidase